MAELSSTAGRAAPSPFGSRRPARSPSAAAPCAARDDQGHLLPGQRIATAMRGDWGHRAGGQSMLWPGARTRDASERGRQQQPGVPNRKTRATRTAPPSGPRPARPRSSRARPPSARPPGPASPEARGDQGHRCGGSPYLRPGLRGVGSPPPPPPPPPGPPPRPAVPAAPPARSVADRRDRTRVSLQPQCGLSVGVAAAGRVTRLQCCRLFQSPRSRCSYSCNPDE